VQSGADSPVASDPASAVQSGAVPAATVKSNAPRIGITALIVVLVLAAGWWLGQSGKETATPSADMAATEGEVVKTSPTSIGNSSTSPSVAILPFADLSPDKDQEYFTDGMTEELLNSLGKINGLKVPSRTAVFALKGKDLDIQQVGERLGVETVLEGSVRKSGNRLRISAQLIQVNDGFQLWTETYDRELEDVFSVQDGIASGIADALRVTLTTEADRVTEIGGTNNTEAYDYYLRGNEYRLGDSNEATKYAIQMYKEAVKLDPNYGLAYAGMAIAYLNQYENAGATTEDLEAIGRASSSALEASPGLGKAHQARALYLYRTGQPESAVAEFEKAIRADPNNPDIIGSFGRTMYTEGELKKAAELWERVVELDPTDRQYLVFLPQVYTSLGREEAAIAAYRRYLEVEERHLELERAFKEAEQILKSGTTESLTLYNTACFYSLAGETDLAINALEKAVTEGQRNADWARQDSDLDNIRDDPRFEKILERMEGEG
jgi:TolB-like protein/Tfp pilus assembly protein PilF